MPLHPFETRLAASWPPEDWKDLTVLAAVSGGGDSVALLRGLAALKLPGEGRLIAAHVNHKLRGADSDADQAFVQELCGQLGLACEVATAAVDPTAGSRGQGIEATARRARYAVLEEMAGRVGARFVVTAHTADDQAETILHRILRGTGIRGLSGMSRSRRLGPATLLRPLLGYRPCGTGRVSPRSSTTVPHRRQQSRRAFHAEPDPQGTSAALGRPLQPDDRRGLAATGRTGR